jgi:thymidine kinase
MLGVLDVYTGSMFSGKTEELVPRLRHLKKIGKRRVLVFYPVTDERTDPGWITSNTGVRFPAEEVDVASQIIAILDGLDWAVDVVAIDEAQFFPEDEEPNLYAVVWEILQRGVDVIVAGLSLDYKVDPFGLMPAFMALALALGGLGKIHHFEAVCVACGRSATLTHRREDGGPVVVVGGEELYDARCPNCHPQIFGGVVFARRKGGREERCGC